MKYLVTGTAGFIGFHLAKRLLESGHIVLGYDGMTDYYDVDLKKSRHSILDEYEKFTAVVGMLEDYDKLLECAESFSPDRIIHLAAQAGVRYSLENPRSYINSNLVGTFNLMEVSRILSVDHLLMASTSSVYGANKIMPFEETDMTDHPLTLYAATKKSNEVMAHSYSSLWEIPTTMFRFFTVYGPHGRPDLALFKFVKATLEGQKIDVYNNGEMARDFTFVDDLVRAIHLLAEVIPLKCGERNENSIIPDYDTLSPAAPFRVVNIGNSDKVKLLDFISAIEDKLGVKTDQNLMPMQLGDVPETWADCRLLEHLTGYKPQTDISKGVGLFIDWYKSHYNVDD